MIPVPDWSTLRAAVERRGYRWFDGGGDYNLNLVGIRGMPRKAGLFDDLFCCAFRQTGLETVLAFACTTDPGRRYLHEPINAHGAAILIPGQYRGMWEIGLHRSRYAALVQRGPCKVWRDDDRDDDLDDGPHQDIGYFGINLHHGLPTGSTASPDEWSAGCQVLRDAEEFRLVMALADLAAVRYGKAFTYTLIGEGDL